MNLIKLVVHALLGAVLFYFLVPGLWFAAMPAGKPAKEQAALHAAGFAACFVAANLVISSMMI